MNNKLITGTFILVIAIYIVGCSSSPTTTQQTSKVSFPEIFKVKSQEQKWEYKTLWAHEHSTVKRPVYGTIPASGDLLSVDSNEDLTKRLNELGAEGWELVDVEFFPEDRTDVVYTFKRPVE